MVFTSRMKRCICPSCRCQSEELSSPGGCSQLHQPQTPVCRAVLALYAALTPPFPGKHPPLRWARLASTLLCSIPVQPESQVPPWRIIWGCRDGARQAKKGYITAEAPSSREITGKPLWDSYPQCSPQSAASHQDGRLRHSTLVSQRCPQASGRRAPNCV